MRRRLGLLLLVALVIPSFAQGTPFWGGDNGTSEDAGDTRETATPIVPGAYTGQLDAVVDDADWYRFDVAAGDIVQVSSLNISLGIYPPTGEAITWTHSLGVPYAFAATHDGAWYLHALRYTARPHMDYRFELDVVAPATRLVESGTSGFAVEFAWDQPGTVYVTMGTSVRGEPSPGSGHAQRLAMRASDHGAGAGTGLVYASTGSGSDVEVHGVRVEGPRSLRLSDAEWAPRTVLFEAAAGEGLVWVAASDEFLTTFAVAATMPMRIAGTSEGVSFHGWSASDDAPPTFMAPGVRYSPAAVHRVQVPEQNLMLFASGGASGRATEPDQRGHGWKEDHVFQHSIMRVNAPAGTWTFELDEGLRTAESVEMTNLVLAGFPPLGIAPQLARDRFP